MFDACHKADSMFLMNSNFSAESDLRDQIHMTSDELSDSLDFSRVSNYAAFTPEAVALLEKMEFFK